MKLSLLVGPIFCGPLYLLGVMLSYRRLNSPYSVAVVGLFALLVAYLFSGHLQVAEDSSFRGLMAATQLFSGLKSISSRFPLRQFLFSSSVSKVSPPFVSSSIPSPSVATSGYRSFSSTAATMSNTHSFWDVIKERRTYYQLNKEAPVSDARIEELVKDAILHTPSSFNSQSARVVVLLKKDHDLFWDFVKECLKPLVPAGQFPATEKKLAGFKAAYGTVSLATSAPF